MTLAFIPWEDKPFCLNGWPGGGQTRPACNYTGGHFCDREYQHDGRCRCDCGSESSTTPPTIDGEEA